MSLMTPLHCPAEPAIDLAPGTLGEWEMPAAQLSCGRAVSSGICVIGVAAQTLTCLPNHLVKVQKGIRWLVYFGEVLSLVRLNGRLIKYS